MIIQAAPKEHFGWICERAGVQLTPRARAIEAVDASGRVRGMVAYDNFTENACEAHMAVASPIIWRSLLKPVFSYPFRELGLGLLLGIVPAHNPKSLAMVKALGFRETYRIRDGYAEGDDLVIHEMRPDECRWLEV